MISQFHLSLTQVLLYAGAWVVLDGIKAVCGHDVDWKPVSFIAFFSAGLLALGFFSLWKPFLP
jgi:hypothetical protein